MALAEEHADELFMSGITADMIAGRVLPEEKANFIQKPFSLKELAAKARKVRTSGG